jgi:diguanylate cyclase (GGDEF)-like protein
MFKILSSSDPKKSLCLYRYLATLLATSVFTVTSIFFFYNNLFSIDLPALYTIIGVFWVGGFIFTSILCAVFNKKSADTSLTVAQILLSTSFLLTITYLLNEWRGLILMIFFGILSFGYFQLKFREFLFIALVAILGYISIVLYIFAYEPGRIELELELVQWMIFSSTITVMLYTGSAVYHLRQRAKKQYTDLQEALELNKTQAITDELTGLYNRRYLIKMLTQQKALSERDGSDFVLCFFDLDRFKQINDTFGHHTGDRVLQKFAEILKSSIREIDYASRFGGEEFVCLLVNSDIEQAIKVTERIRQSLADYNFSDIAPSLYSTVSIGLSNFKQFNTIQEILMSADNRMYRAKDLGRNRVVYSDEDKECILTIKDADVSTKPTIN